MSLPELSNFDIDHYYIKNPFYGGCFSKDVLPMKLQNKFYIVNLANNNKPGTHWVLLYNVSPTIVIYFDPMGVPYAPTEVVLRMKETKKHMQYSIYDVQAFKSESCGYYCCYVADKLYEVDNQNDLIIGDILKKHFYVNNTYGEKENEKVLKNYFKNVFTTR